MRNGKHVSAILLTVVTVFLLALAVPARAADPIKVGFSMALTGSVAQNGKQLIMALELWRDDINASGGLLGRPVELVYYDDQSNPSNVPGIYTKLITVDKVDLLLGPYATNMAAAAVPVIMQHNMTTISILAVDVNRHFHYSRYFDMIPVGPEGTRAFSKGFFALAATQKPRPQTVAIVSADAEFSKTSADGARENANAEGFKIIYDQGYPPSTTDFAPVMRAVCVRCRLSAGYGRHRARCCGNRAHSEDVRRYHDRPSDHADQNAARTAARRHCHHGKFRPGAKL